MERFAAGEPYSAAKLPYVPQGRLVQDLVNYPSLTGFKAMAVAANGYGVALNNPLFASQAEANQIVLESCQIIANNMPCAIFAEGDVIKFKESDFYLNQVSVLQTGPRTFDVTKIPTYLIYWETIFLNNWNGTTQPFKSVAIGNYGLAMRGWGDSQAEADRRALEMCESLNNETCTLYASGNNVVFNVTSFNWNYTQKYVQFAPRAYSAAQVPFVADADRANASGLGMVPAYTSQNRNPVVAISRYGHYYVAFSSNNMGTLAANRAAALAGCNPQVSDPKVDCVIYSENNQVVMTRASLEAGNLP